MIIELGINYDGAGVGLGPVTINLAPPITPEFWTGFANTYEIP